MPPSAVALVRARSYDPSAVARALAEALALLEIEELGRGSILAEGAVVGSPGNGPPARNGTVLLKPNLLIPSQPEQAVTTHPAVFGAVARWLQRQGESLCYGDSPSFELQAGGAARRSGIAAEAEALGIPSVEFEHGEDVSWPRGIVHRRFHLARGLLEAGALVNLPKLKTHGLTVMTGALKNLFGTVPGFRKKDYHVTHPDRAGFSRMIADLNALVRPQLVVMDAIQAMEGNGPSGGKVIEVGLLIVSRDPVAVDAVACRVAGIDGASVPLLAMAEEAGAGNASLERIEIRGVPLQEACGRPFVLQPRVPTAGVPAIFLRAGKRALVPRPVIDRAACRRCGTCVKACPARPAALAAGPDGVPRFSYGKCIRCYCCQEVCPHGAVLIRRPPLAALLPRG